MATNMTAMNISIDYTAGDKLDWTALSLVSSPAQRPASVFGSRRSGTELENADMVAAREFGQKRRQGATGAQVACHNSKSGVPARSWLGGDPFRWRGRKIMHRASGAVYTVRQVFHSGRVELKKTFMLYLTTVNTIREDYEPAV